MLVFSLSKYDSVFPLLRQLRWPKALKRIQFRLAVLTFECLYVTVPPYLADEWVFGTQSSGSSLLSVIVITDHPSYTVVDCWQPSFPGHFSLCLDSGMIYHVTSCLCEFSGSRLKTHLFSRSCPDFFVLPVE